MGEIKCIAYVSKAPLIKRGVVLPVGLSEIVRSAKRNDSLALSGLLSYRKGYYVQVIEGPRDTVDSLIAKIFEDSRHLDPIIFIDKFISDRCFHECNISVFDFVDQNHMFEKLVNAYKSEFTHLADQPKQRIQQVYDVDAQLNATPSQPKSNTKSYDGKSVKLLAWPDFNRINHSPALMNLCIKLTKEAHPFEQLVSNAEFGTREEVTAMINSFDDLSILEVSEAEQSQQQQQTTNNKKPSRFYGAIKKFLGMG